MIPRQLFLDSAKCRIPTDHSTLNSRDEVYFLVAGATSGGKSIKIAPDPDHNDVDYYPVSSGHSIDNVVLATADMKDGDSLAFTVVMCDQDNAQLGAIEEALEGVVLAALAWLAEDPSLASAATERFIQSGVDLVNSVQGNHDQVIAAFAVRVKVDHGNIKAQWLPILFVTIASAGDVKATMHANGGESNYVLSFGVSDASQMLVNGGLLGKQHGTFKHVGISTITNGTSALPATLLEKGDDSLLAQVWDLASSGQFVEKSRIDANPATALATTSANIGLAAAVRDKASGNLRAILWDINELDKLVWQDAAGLDAASDFAITGLGDIADRRLVIAAIGPNHKLQISVWDKVLPKGSQTYKLKRLSDNGTDTVEATHVAVAPWSKGVITAIQRHDGNHLQLIAWRIDAKGKLTKTGMSGATDIEIDEVAIINTSTDRENTSNRVVTAARASDNVLHVTVWEVAADGSKVSRIDGDTPPAPAHVAQFALAPMGPLTYIDVKLVAAQVATAAVRLEGGKLRLCIWNISKNGRLSRAYDHDFNVVKEVAMDFWKIGTANYGGPPTPESIVVAAASMADSSLGLFQFGASVNTVIVG